MDKWIGIIGGIVIGTVSGFLMFPELFRVLLNILGIK